MRFAHARKKQTQIIMNFRNRTNGRARIAVGGFLVNSNRRGQTLNHINRRLFQATGKVWLGAMVNCLIVVAVGVANTATLLPL
jgi:hypothetical protein